MGKIVTIKPGCEHHRMKLIEEDEQTRVEEITFSSGQVFEATEDELRAFGDKFIASAIDATAEAWEMLKGRDVDLRLIPGTGKDGRILKRDVEEFFGELES